MFTAPASIALAATATDDGSIAKVEFFSGATLIATDTSAPYTFNWTAVPAGVYTLTAKATDNLGVQTTSAARSVPVNPGVNLPPTVSLTSPANNATYTAPASIALSANAQDSDGTITQVDFYNGATLIGTVTTAPYNATWAAVPASSYTITAKATDNLGVSTTSAPITVTVQPAAPAGMYFIHPDHLNTPRLITDAAGTVVWRWDNDDPFGNNAPNENPAGVGSFTCNLRLPGQYFDRETNLHYNYFRDYDPAIGRYVQSDPIGLHGGVNTYGYVGGSPIGRSDPSGLIVPVIVGLCAVNPLACGAVVSGAVALGGVLAAQVNKSKKKKQKSEDAPVLCPPPQDDCNEEFKRCNDSGWGGKVGFDSACLACFRRCQGTGSWPTSITSGLWGELQVSCEYWLRNIPGRQ